LKTGTDSLGRWITEKRNVFQDFKLIFGAEPPDVGAIANFCALYLSEEDRKYMEAGGYAVKFMDYDWSLNERKDSP